MIVLSADFESSAPAVDDPSVPVDPVAEVCFVGRSNVGKSSLLNALTHRHNLARVSSTPGRTRLLNFFGLHVADRAGQPRREARVRFCDLPGYGHAVGPRTERARWAEMIGGYLRHRGELRAIVWLIDGEIGPQPRDLEMRQVLETSPAANPWRGLIIVATKLDRLPVTRRRSQLDRIAAQLQIPTAALIGASATDKAGVDDVWNAIFAACGIWNRHSDGLLVRAEPLPEAPVAVVKTRPPPAPVVDNIERLPTRTKEAPRFSGGPSAASGRFRDTAPSVKSVRSTSRRSVPARGAETPARAPSADTTRGTSSRTSALTTPREGQRRPSRPRWRG